MSRSQVDNQLLIWGVSAEFISKQCPLHTVKSILKTTSAEAIVVVVVGGGGGGCGEDDGASDKAGGGGGGDDGGGGGGGGCCCWDGRTGEDSGGTGLGDDDTRFEASLESGDGCDGAVFLLGSFK